MKALLLIVLLILAINQSFGKPNIYTESKVFSGSDFKYRCVRLASIITLFNDSNIYNDNEVRYKDSSVVNDINIIDGTTVIVEEDSMMSHFDEIVEANLTSQQIEQIDNFSDIYSRELFSIIKFNPETGRIIEIAYQFYDDGPWSNIPVSAFRNIERMIKQRIRITFSEVGKSLLVGSCLYTIYKLH